MAERLAAFDRVWFSYDGRPILEEASLALSTGEVVGLLGLNGTGKTTTMRLIARILDPERGAVERTYRRLGYLPEERGLYRRLTVERYLRFVGELNGLPKADLRPAVDRLMEQFRLEEYRGRRIEALSKGNQQKVQLAATLVPSPDLMLWDEPFSGLDALNQDLLLDVLRDLRSRGVAVLLSTHRLDDLELLADRTYILAKKRFVEYIPPRQPAGYRVRFDQDGADRSIEVASDELPSQVQECAAHGWPVLSVTPKTGLESIFRELLGEGA